MAPVEWILLVEDEADQRLLVKAVLGRVSAQSHVHEAVDAETAMTWLRRVAADPSFLKEGMVVLDLGLPGASGFRVLEWMRDVPALKEVPVVVLTASENPMDADHAFNLGARGYFQKPADPQLYVDIFQRALRIVESGSGSPERS